MGISQKRNKRLLLCYMYEIGHKCDNVSKRGGQEPIKFDGLLGWANIVISFITPTRGSLNIDDMKTEVFFK